MQQTKEIGFIGGDVSWVFLKVKNATRVLRF
jgi:hypothetical protein